jgi:O-antigen/teichoic acid export membrane protein
MNASVIFKKFLKTQDARSSNIIKNIFGSFAVKGISIAVNLALIPLTIHYLSSLKYGVWLTISSTLGWINFFDIGLGHGLRNKLTEAIAKGEMNKAKSYVSTAYVSITLMCAVLFGVFMIINNFLDWNTLLNIPKEVNESLKQIALIVFSMFALQFILQLINSILLSTQQSYKVGLISMLSNVFAFIGVFILTKYVTASLYSIAFIFSVIPVLVYAITNIYYFKTSFKDFSPSIKFFQRSALNDVLHVGVKFFIIQISVLVLMGTSNILICNYLDPSFVTPYNVAFRYFAVITMAFSIIMVPYWSAYTEAYVKNDFAWIRKTIKQALRLWVIFVVGAFIMLSVSSFAYSKWVNDATVTTRIDFTLSCLMMLYVILITFGSVFMMLLNGIGQIKLQMTVNIIGMCLFFPLSYFLVKVLGMGLSGIILSTILCSAYGYIVAPLEVRRVLQKHRLEEEEQQSVNNV